MLKPSVKAPWSYQKGREWRETEGGSKALLTRRLGHGRTGTGRWQGENPEKYALRIP